MAKSQKTPKVRHLPGQPIIPGLEECVNAADQAEKESKETSTTENGDLKRTLAAMAKLSPELISALGQTQEEVLKKIRWAVEINDLETGLQDENETTVARKLMSAVRMCYLKIDSDHGYFQDLRRLLFPRVRPRSARQRVKDFCRVVSVGEGRLITVNDFEPGSEIVKKWSTEHIKSIADGKTSYKAVIDSIRKDNNAPVASVHRPLTVAQLTKLLEKAKVHLERLNMADRQKLNPLMLQLVSVIQDPALQKPE